MAHPYLRLVDSYTSPTIDSCPPWGPALDEAEFEQSQCSYPEPEDESWNTWEPDLDEAELEQLREEDRLEALAYREFKLEQLREEDRLEQLAHIEFELERLREEDGIEALACREYFEEAELEKLREEDRLEWLAFRYYDETESERLREEERTEWLASQDYDEAELEKLREQDRLECLAFQDYDEAESERLREEERNEWLAFQDYDEAELERLREEDRLEYLAIRDDEEAELEQLREEAIIEQLASLALDEAALEQLGEEERLQELALSNITPDVEPWHLQDILDRLEEDIWTLGRGPKGNMHRSQSCINLNAVHDDLAKSVARRICCTPLDYYGRTMACLVEERTGTYMFSVSGCSERPWPHDCDTQGVLNRGDCTEEVFKLARILDFEIKEPVNYYACHAELQVLAYWISQNPKAKARLDGLDKVGLEWREAIQFEGFVEPVDVYICQPYQGDDMCEECMALFAQAAVWLKLTIQVHVIDAFGVHRVWF